MQQLDLGPVALLNHLGLAGVPLIISRWCNTLLGCLRQFVFVNSTQHTLSAPLCVDTQHTQECIPGKLPDNNSNTCQQVFKSQIPLPPHLWQVHIVAHVLERQRHRLKRQRHAMLRCRRRRHSHVPSKPDRLATTSTPSRHHAQLHILPCAAVCHPHDTVCTVAIGSHRGAGG